MSELIICLDMYDEPPANFTGIVQLPDKSKHWFVNGLMHREGGPAVIYANGAKEWWINNKRHREDGPAIEDPFNSNHWYLNYEFIYNDLDFLALEGNYVVLERGIPTSHEFMGIKLTEAKLLTANGTLLIIENLPGMNIGEGNN
jgi:hypothetical protein